MRSIVASIQVFLLAIVLDMRGCTPDVQWTQIYDAMIRNGKTNLRSSCPWTYQAGSTTQLVYKNGKCLDLDRIDPKQPHFLSHGRCQPIFIESCIPNQAVAYTCVHNYRRELIMGKRNEHKDPYMCAPVTPPEINNTENATPQSNVKPIVRTTDGVIETNSPETYKEQLINNNTDSKTSQENKPEVSRSPLLGLLFPSYLLNSNAQFNPHVQTVQTPLQRTFPETVAGGQGFIFYGNHNS